MGKLLEMLVAAEESVHSRIGRWRQEISKDVDSLNSGGVSVTGGFEFFTQSDFGVNSASGNNGGAGTSADPVQSLPELARRWEGRVFSPDITQINVALTGSFPNDALILNATVPGAIPVEITAQPSTAVASGTLTGYQQSNSTLRGSITDAAQNFTGLAPRRIRIDSGTVPGAVTWFNSIAAATIANTGQFERAPTIGASFATTNPIVGDHYVVEDLVTRVRECSIAIQGQATVTINNLIIGSLVSTFVPRSYFNVNGQSTRCRLNGCLFLNPSGGTQLVSGAALFAACCNRGGSALSLFQGVFTLMGHCHFEFFQTTGAANMVGNRALHDGNGTTHVGMVLGNQSYLEDIGDRGFFGNVNGTIAAHVDIQDFGQWVMNAGANTFWGAAGNTTTVALIVRNGCGMSYTTKPTATGGTPGNDVTISAEAVRAWAAIPALAATPNNGFVNVRQ